MTGDPILRELLTGPVEEDDEETREWRWRHVALQLHKIARFALRGLLLLEGDVDDLVQEIILRFIDSPSLRRTAGEVHSPNLYLARTLRNAGVDLLRRRERHQRLRSLRPPSERERVDEIERIHAELEMQRLANIIRGLPVEDRDLIRERFWDELSLQEIAERHRTAVSTSAYRLIRILAAIRRQLVDR